MADACSVLYAVDSCLRLAVCDGMPRLFLSVCVRLLAVDVTAVPYSDVLIAKLSAVKRLLTI